MKLVKKALKRVGKIRTIGIIGLGSIGERHVRNIQKKYSTLPIDILTTRKTWADAGPNTRLVPDSKKFYETKHDVYFITNETAQHTDTILKCVAQNPRGIFVEKPVAHSSRDIARIRKALAKKGIVFFVGYCLQFYKPLVIMKKILTAGTIGAVLSMRVSAGSDLRTWRKGDYLKRYSSDTKRGGGVVLDLIHELNYPSWLLGETLEYVTGFYGRVLLPIHAEDISEGIFRTKSGVVVSVHQDYIQTPGRRYCEIFGTKGTLVWEDDAAILSVRTSTRRNIAVRDERNVMYEKELNYFFGLVRSGSEYSNFEEAAHDLINADKLKKTYATRT